MSPRAGTKGGTVGRGQRPKISARTVYLRLPHPLLFQVARQRELDVGLQGLT